MRMKNLRNLTFPDILFALSHIHVEQLRALDREEVQATLSRYGLGEEGLAGTWRPVE